MMFFRSHPLIEASVNYVVAGLLSVASFFIVTGFNFSEVIGLTQLQGMYVMLPAFFLWSIVGFALRNSGYLARFVGAAAVTIAVTLLTGALFMQVAEALSNPADRTAYLNLRVIPVLGTFAVNSLIGAAFCQFWLVRRYEE
jgi:hydrogenase-4 membrane subunit HyfE